MIARPDRVQIVFREGHVLDRSGGFPLPPARPSAQTGGMIPRAAARRRVLPGSPFNDTPAEAPPAETYSANDRVSHDRYGLGTVVGMEDGGGAVLVDFGSGTRRVSLPSPKLTKL
jgi:hypothetical protein